MLMVKKWCFARLIDLIVDAEAEQRARPLRLHRGTKTLLPRQKRSGEQSFESPTHSYA